MQKVTCSLVIAILILIFAPISISLASTNLVTNPGAETGDATGWSNIVNGGDGWVFDWGAHSGDYGFNSSYLWNSMDQTIDLLDFYTQEQLNTKPNITFSSWIMQRGDHHGEYYMIYEIRDSSNNVIVSHTYGSEISPIHLDAGTEWFENEYTFTNYGTSPRYAYIKFAGWDGGEWAGAYGPYFDDFSIEVNFSASRKPTFSKDKKCYASKPEELTWLKLIPTTKEDVEGMEVTWTQIGATSLDIYIDDGTGSYPWKISKVKNTGHKFLPNVKSWQKIKIKAFNKCTVGEFSEEISYNLFPQGWYNL